MEALPLFILSTLFSVIKTANPIHSPYPETCLLLAENEEKEIMSLLVWGGPVTALWQLQT